MVLYSGCEFLPLLTHFLLKGLLVASSFSGIIGPFNQLSGIQLNNVMRKDENIITSFFSL